MSDPAKTRIHLSHACLEARRRSCLAGLDRRQVLPRSAIFASALALGIMVTACGGGTDSAGTASTPVAASKASPINNGAYDPSLLLLLLPDSQNPDDARVTAWLDAASEVGVRMLPISDSQFTTLGEGALQYAGLVLPDDLHAIASDDIIATIKSYAERGGSVMLTFDFGALTLRSDGAPVYPIPRSRLSELAGVEYVLYDELRDRTTGIGPVVGMRSTLRALQVPPGKSMPYGSTTLTAKVAPVDLPRYLPVSPADPGGVQGYDPQQFQTIRTPSADERRSRRLRARVPVDFGKAIQGARVAGVPDLSPLGLDALTASAPVPRTPAAGPPASVPATTPSPQTNNPGSTADPGAVSATAPAVATAKAEAGDALHAYTGYLIGELQYPTYVTRGSYPGQTIATSPNFGLVAGLHAYGAGRVMFVNLPLTYLKGRTDALPMHGYLGYFARQVLRLPNLSEMPDAVGGLVFNWHLDSMEAQEPTLALERDGVFRRGPFSINMTAGPDTVTPGDGLGWNLDGNVAAQELLRRLRDAGHSIGSHGGWIHDYYGLNATESNQADFEPFITMNMASVDAVVGAASREYSAPEGNNPLWAMDYLESRGVVGAYFGGHTGLGATRHYREGTLRNPQLHVFPVTPNGLYATFDEFQEFGQTKPSVLDWYRNIIDFSIEWNTNRLIYAHPPAANDWRDVLKQALTYAQKKGPGAFRWYTMPQLADYAATRRQVRWTETVQPDGSVQFNVTHPTSLARMVIRLPKARFQKPVIAPSLGSVGETTTYWLVRAKSVAAVNFTAQPSP